MPNTFLNSMQHRLKSNKISDVAAVSKQTEKWNTIIMLTVFGIFAIFITIYILSAADVI